MSQKQALAALSRREALLLAAGATMVAAGGVVLKAGTANADLSQLRNAQGEGTGSAGGYLVPTTFREMLVERMRAFGGVASDLWIGMSPAWREKAAEESGPGASCKEIKKGGETASPSCYCARLSRASR